MQNMKSVQPTRRFRQYRLEQVDRQIQMYAVVRSHTVSFPSPLAYDT